MLTHLLSIVSCKILNYTLFAVKWREKFCIYTYIRHCETNNHNYCILLFFIDADVEDNVESDVVKNRYANLSGTESRGADANFESNTIPRISGSKMTLVNGVAFTGNGVALETMNRMSKSDSELCAQVSSGAKNSDSFMDVDSLTTSISSMGISNDTSTLRSVSSEDIVGKQKDMVNGFVDDIDHHDTQNEAAENKEESNSSKSKSSSLKHANDAAALPRQVRSRSEIKYEMKVKATNTLVPRYQPSGHECSVLSCVNQFTAMELLTGNNKFGCEKCTFRKHGRQNKEGTLYRFFQQLGN